MTDKRQVRGEVRRRAWASAANIIAERMDSHSLPGEFAELYRDTLIAIQRFCRQRGRGQMGPPPGGVGSRKAVKA